MKWEILRWVLRNAGFVLFMLITVVVVNTILVVVQPASQRAIQLVLFNMVWIFVVAGIMTSDLINRRYHDICEWIDRKERESKLDKCSICHQPIREGAYIGTGDGTMRANDGRGSFAHPECYRELEAAREVETYLGLR